MNYKKEIEKIIKNSGVDPKIIFDLYQQKVLAMENRDEELWDKILKQEEQLLEKYS
jgi:hypothetical protein